MIMCNYNIGAQCQVHFIIGSLLHKGLYQGVPLDGLQLYSFALRVAHSVLSTSFMILNLPLFTNKRLLIWIKYCFCIYFLSVLLVCVSYFLFSLMRREVGQFKSSSKRHALMHGQVDAEVIALANVARSASAGRLGCARTHTVHWDLSFGASCSVNKRIVLTFTLFLIYLRTFFVN